MANGYKLLEKRMQRFHQAEKDLSPRHRWRKECRNASLVWRLIKEKEITEAEKIQTGEDH